MRKFSSRALALLLTLTFILSAVVALPASAMDINEIPPEDFVWELDFDKMSSITDNLGSNEYSLSLKPNGSNDAEFPLSLTEKDGKKCLAIENGNGTYFIHDDNNVLADYSTFSIEANMYFEKFPETLPDSTDTPRNYPISFLTWMTKSDASSSTFQYHSIRIDDEGYLCTKANPAVRTEAKLPLQEWFNIRFVISPATKSAEVYLNGQHVVTYNLNSKVTVLGDSVVRFFDTRYAYTAYFSDLSVYTANDYRIGLVDEVAADFVGYQTTKIQNGTFDLRVLAGLEGLNYSTTGYEVVAIRQGKNNTTKSDEYSSTSTVVYEEVSALNAAGNPVKVKASELGSKYLAAIAVPDLPAGERMEIVIRPYATQKGLRRYGDATILVYTGEQKDGYPILVSSKNVTTYTATASEDTFVRLQTKVDNSASDVLEIKNNGKNSDYTRFAFIKFAFSDVALERLGAASRIYLRCRVKNARSLTAEEQELGGILLDVYGTDTAWIEKNLSGINMKDIAADMQWVNEAYYRSGEYLMVDVTDYVLANASSGEISFRLENIAADGSNDPARIYSSESNYPPELVITTRMFDHEINLGKLNNLGYEPWGYAEKIVDEWIATDYLKLFGVEEYDTIDLEAVDISAANGEHTIKSDWKSSSPTAKWNVRVHARSIATLNGYTAGAASEYDQYGGITNSGIKGEATGYFHTEVHGNRTYIIDPLGNPFFAVGVNTVELGATDNQRAASLDKYGTEETFYKEVSEELRDYGINTVWGGWANMIETGNLVGAGSVGCISKYMSQLGLSISTGGSAEYLHNNTMNVFDPDFVTFVRDRVETVVVPYADNPYILGWYSDNEIPSQSDMLYCYLTIDPSEPVNAFSYATAWTFLAKRTGNPNPSTSDVTPELSEEFKAFVYNRYYKVITTELEKAAPNQMYMGNRIHGENKSSEGYLRAAGAYVDLLTVNLYGGLEPSIESIKYMYRYSGKPFIVTEFFAKADDAVDMNGYSLGNQTNAGWIVKTQADRAIHFENYVLLLLESQTCVGWTWYRFRDNDQTIYQDEAGNLYRAYDYKNKALYGYVNVETGELIDPSVTMKLTVFYKGEGDTSNLGSNKGLYDNHMNPYTELLEAHERVSDSIFSLINFFDARNAK